MDQFTPISALVGGVIIGASVSLLWIAVGKIGGISGILAGATALSISWLERSWRLTFLAGLLVGAAVAFAFFPERFGIGIERSMPAWIGAGLLVGFGTRLGGGCTSGHGVCGISRLSTRSLVATGTFMFTAGVVVWAVRAFAGGSV